VLLAGGEVRTPVHIILATPAPVSHRTAEENLGLGYLAATLRSGGYAVRVVDGWLEGLTSASLAQEITRGPQPLFVGFSCYRSNMERALEAAEIVRARRPCPVIAGGFGPTFHTEEFLSAGFDIVVRGEGEATVLDLAGRLAAGNGDLGAVAGISFRRDGRTVHNPARPPVADLDALPRPDHDTLALSLARRSMVHVQSSRGCQASCTFCSIVAFERLAGPKTWRERSLSGFVDELEHLASLGVTHAKVIDDSLIEPPRDAAWCRALADEIAARGVRMQMRGSIRADRVDDETVGQLARAGFFSFSCGIENFAPGALRRMAKRASLRQNLEALDVLRRHGMVVQAGHILFDEATTLDELEENHRLMTRYDWTVSKGVFTEMYAAAGTNFTRRLAREGALVSGAPVAGTAGLGNADYAVRDERARFVYTCLKSWQRSHGRIYDKAIDPLSAPKAIGPAARAEFLAVSVALRRHDLAFFRTVLDAAWAGVDSSQASELVAEAVAGSDGFYAGILRDVEACYARAGLIYDADDNPFTC
jgi:anaerobic magnesium-protoporphyrin IX monomethyl ester cyclase